MYTSENGLIHDWCTIDIAYGNLPSEPGNSAVWAEVYGAEVWGSSPVVPAIICWFASMRNDCDSLRVDAAFARVATVPTLMHKSILARGMINLPIQVYVSASSGGGSARLRLSSDK